MMLLKRIKESATRSAQHEADVDITPMLDVVFILLIFFIVTASFVRESGFGVNKPISGGSDLPLKSIILQIDSNDDIRIQNRPVLPVAVRSTMVQLLAETPAATVSVRVHPLTTTKAMVGAIDGIRSANFLLPAVTITRT